MQIRKTFLMLLWSEMKKLNKTKLLSKKCQIAVKKSYDINELIKMFA